MAKITKVTTQKNRKRHRYNIFLDGQFAFGVDEAVLVKYHLLKGTELDKDQIKMITSFDQQNTAYLRALDYLSYGLRTAAEVEKKLADFDTPASMVPPVMERLSQQGYVDDSNYAKSYVRTEMRLDLKGPGFIRQHLKQKHVADEVIEQALELFTPDIQLTNATKLAKKVFKRQGRRSARQQEERVRRNLIQNGYNSNIIQQALAAARPEPDPKHEADLLDREAKKAWHHYGKYQSYERKQRVKQLLFRKGYQLDDIERWLDENV
ncbi:recombination regulator RecX [Limosilactobacillus sp.]|uniref:recombination regulator RecX n=1 Tax=Limosilactobacillus sp. TaxID=2773925 RepID=UPI00345E9944